MSWLKKLFGIGPEQLVEKKKITNIEKVSVDNESILLEPKDSNTVYQDIKNKIWEVAGPTNITLRGYNYIVGLGEQAVPAAIAILRNPENQYGMADQIMLVEALVEFAKKGNKEAIKIMNEIVLDKVAIYNPYGDAQNIAYKFLSEEKKIGDSQEQLNDLPADFSPPSEVIGVLSKTILDLIRSKNAENAIKTLRAIRKADDNGIYDKGKFPSTDEIREALPLVKWATEKLPNNPIAWMARCVVLDLAVFVHYGIDDYKYSNSKDEIIEVFTKVTQKASKYPEAWIPKGLLFKGFASSPTNLSIALEAYDAALKLKPGMEDALYGKAQLYDKYNDYRKALSCYKELAELYPEQEVYQNAARELAEIVPSYLQGK